MAVRVRMGFHTGETVRELVSGQPFAFDDLGERPMKGFEQPVRVWSARWSDM